MRVRWINAVKLVEASDLVAILDEGSAIWMEMTRNGYRFNLEGWSLSRVAMVVFGSDQWLVLLRFEVFRARTG
eukprot:scaffold31132_cov34-Attheya_sp.AAC.2